MANADPVTKTPADKPTKQEPVKTAKAPVDSLESFKTETATGLTVYNFVKSA